MNREIAELVTAAAEIAIAKKFSYWELQVRKEKANIASVLKRVEFWIKEVGKVEGGRGSMVERALKDARDNLKKASSLLDPLSQVSQLGEGLPSKPKKGKPPGREPRDKSARWTERFAA